MGSNGIAKRSQVQSLVICLLIFLVSLWTSVNTASAQASQQTKKDFLWAVKTDKATVYLLGSLHLLKSDSYPLDRNIEDAYRDCKRICLEADIDRLKDPTYQTTMLAQGLYPEGQTLAQNISKETYSLLEKKAAEVGLSMAQLNRFKPWLCNLTLVGLELQRKGFDPTYGVDTYFFNKAKKDGKEMLFLETVEFQMKLFSELDSNEGESLLRQSLKDLEVIDTMLPDMVKAWENGDDARLGSIMNISFKDHPDIYNRFVVQRNKAWVGTIEGLLAQGGTSLVVAGAGHFVGPENLLQLLKGKGYTIEQIPTRAGVAASAEQDLAHALYIRSGMEQQMRSLPLAIQVGFDQARNQNERLRQIPQDAYGNIKGLLAESFAAGRLNDQVIRHIKAQLGQDEMQKILAWLNSPLGKKCSALFQATATPQSTAELKAFMAKSKKSPVLPARRNLIQKLADATKAVETTLEVAVNTQLVVTAVMGTTAPTEQQKPFSTILTEVFGNRPLLEPKVRQQITPLLLYLCRSLSNAELEKYLAFARSSGGAHYFTSVFNGIKLALIDSSVRFGSSLADLQWMRRQAGEAL